MISSELRVAVQRLRTSSKPLHELIPLLQRAADLIDKIEPDAEKWVALRNCARITMMGSAGLHPDGPTFNTPHAHITLNFWTDHSEGAGDPADRMGREWMDRFVNKAVANQREADRRFGQPHYGHDEYNGKQT